MFEDWPRCFPAARFIAPDLQMELEVAGATMGDYTRRVERAAVGAEAPLLLAEWSMGGLVAMLVADTIRPDALVLLEPSPPGEVQGFHHGGPPIRSGTFDPERVYGSFPSRVRARPESGRGSLRASPWHLRLPAPMSVARRLRSRVPRGTGECDRGFLREPSSALSDVRSLGPRPAPGGSRGDSARDGGLAGDVRPERRSRRNCPSPFRWWVGPRLGSFAS